MDNMDMEQQYGGCRPNKNICKRATATAKRRKSKFLDVDDGFNLSLRAIGCANPLVHGLGLKKVRKCRRRTASKKTDKRTTSKRVISVGPNVGIIEPLK